MEISFGVRTAIDSLPVNYTTAGLMIGENSVVEYWEKPVQERLAVEALRAGPRVIEIGYGLGMCAQALAAKTPAIHLIIEAHINVAAAARDALRPSGVRVLHGLWEHELTRQESSAFDAIVFDAYPLIGPIFDGSPAATIELIRPVLSPAASVLRTGGGLLFIDFTRTMRRSVKLHEEWKVYYSGLQFINIPVEIPVECTYAEGNSADIVILQH
jgi:SAM-dependent methyltransferase